MNLAYELAFTVFPYLCLTIFIVGHAYRYLTDRYSWNARSSEFLEKKSLFYGSYLFHGGLLLALGGHAGGMLTPQSLLDVVGINIELHLFVAHWSGLVAGSAAFAGSLLLLRRRTNNSRIKAVGTVNDVITISGLLFVIAIGLFNVVFTHYNVPYTVAPWIRGILFFTPDPNLMLDVPISVKLHILSALALLAFSPFSRLVHIWSAPVSYAFRRYIVFRR
jgi:nitrate reductase gamma subunit